MKKMTYDLHLRLDAKINQILENNLETRNKQLKKKMNQSEYVRQLICRDNLEQIGFDKETLLSCIRVLAGLGNNVNQIAHNMNSEIYTLSDLEQLRVCLRDIADIKKQILTLMKEMF